MTGEKVAIISNRIVTGGGAEQVAFDMARALDAPIFVPCYDDDEIPDNVDIHAVFPRWMHGLVKGYGILGEALGMLQWPRVDALDDYDTVIVNMPRAGWWVPSHHHRVLMYSHGTQPFVFGNIRRHSNIVKQMMFTAASTAYAATLNKYSRIACNSCFTAKQMSLFHGLDDSVFSIIHPTASVLPSLDTIQGDTYVSMSRISDEKQIDVLVNIMNDLKLPTTIAGTGPNLARVKSMADAHIDFPGWVSGEGKRDLLKSAKAMVILCKTESFGISALEALMAGVPIIAIEGSAVDEMIIHGKNGYACKAQELAGTIARFEDVGVKWKPSKIQSDATRRYPPEAFNEKIRKWVYE